MSTDCLIIGFNDSDFADYVRMVRSMGDNAGAFRDLSLAFIEYNNKPYRALDMLTHFYSQGKTDAKPFHNTDFLWPAIPYLGTYLSRRGLSFDYVNLFQMEKETLRERLAEDDVMAVAITTTLYVTPHPILEIISYIRKYNGRVKIIVGGMHVYNLSSGGDMDALQRQLKYLGADLYVISQEGEFALAGILKALKSGSGLDGIHNIAYKKGDGYAIGPLSRESNPLEENMVDYRLFSRDALGEFLSLRTSKSCPFSCAFCGFPKRAGKYTFLNVGLVEKELDAIRAIGGVTTLTFLDDSFNVPLKRFKEVLRMMIRNDYGFRWNSFYRCDHGDEETIALMKEAGCEGVFLGVESGSDDMLKRMKKTSRREDYLRAIPMFRDAGILTHVSLVIGFPGETLETVRETTDLVEESQPDFFRAQLWYCDPMTPIWEKRGDYGLQGSAFNWSYNTMDSQTACDLVDKTFLSVKNSIWLPQYGFELWSLFYLQRKGMSIGQIKTFIQCFNAVIKERLLFPSMKDSDPVLMESLRQSCLFDCGGLPDMRPVELFSGGRYEAAERFWTEEFGGNAPASNIEEVIAAAPTGNDGLVSWQRTLERSVLHRFGTACRMETSYGILAAYSILLSRLNGMEDTAIVFSYDEGGCGETVVPLRLRPLWNLSFREFAGQVEQKVRLAKGHQKYAFYVLGRLPKAPDHGQMPLRFDVGYRYLRSNGEWPADGLEKLCRSYPEVVPGIGLVLDVFDGGRSVILRLLQKKGRFTQEFIDRLGLCMASLLEEAGKNPGVLLGEIMLEGRHADLKRVVENDAREAFQF